MKARGSNRGASDMNGFVGGGQIGYCIAIKSTDEDAKGPLPVSKGLLIIIGDGKRPVPSRP
jgi:hypothetical protein